MEEEEARSNTAVSDMVDKAKGSRVGRELSDMYFQAFFISDLFKSLLRVLLDVLVIWCFLWLIQLFYTIPTVEPVCVRECITIGSERCCVDNVWFIFRQLLFCLSLFVASSVSSLLKKKRKLQHSVSVTVVTLAILWLVLNDFEISGFSFWLTIIISYFAMFFGYQFSFTVGRKIKNIGSSE